MKMWIEMSRDEEHGGKGWEFTTCVWAPTYKNSKIEHAPWPFWENVNSVKAEDIIFHLRGKAEKAEFVGYSIAETNGYKTKERPEIPGKWAYCSSFYRALLSDYTEFKMPINLYQLFEQKEAELKDYFENKEENPKNIFFVIQNGRLRCLNGAYLSEMDEKLFEILFDNCIDYEAQDKVIESTVETSTVLSNVKSRIGHAKFADNVKKNYNYQCCFPGCTITDPNFLIASHIARWSDNIERRGDTANGLCLCLMHDKAFELGYFVLDDDFKVDINFEGVNNSQRQILQAYISKYEGMSIKEGVIPPDKEALEEHRKRCSKD